MKKYAIVLAGLMASGCLVAMKDEQKKWLPGGSSRTLLIGNMAEVIEDQTKIADIATKRGLANDMNKKVFDGANKQIKMATIVHDRCKSNELFSGEDIIKVYTIMIKMGRTSVILGNDILESDRS